MSFKMLNNVILSCHCSVNKGEHCLELSSEKALSKIIHVFV